jgi:DNA repair exonuclease SbcCD ATPase subunit
MKNITVSKLNISNFKGITQKTISFDNTTSFRGANGSGKSTIADAIWFVLFNKDSNGNGPDKAEIKMKGADGEDIHNLLIDVQLELLVNGQVHVFRRSQYEDWKTPRGTNVAIFDGNKQSLYYNETNLSTKEYAEAVNSILDEEMFKLLTNPMYFMSLDHKKRREFLVAMVGSLDTLENEIRKQTAYFILDAEWSSDLNRNKSFSQFYETMKQKVKENSEELKRLPFQIDELTRTITDLPDEAQVKTLISVYTKELNELSNVVFKPTDNSLIADEQELRQKQNELHTIVDEANAKLRAKRTESAQARQEQEYLIGSKEAKLSLLKNEISEADSWIQKKQAERDALRNKYREVESRNVPNVDIQTECPVCHQTLPDINVDKIKSDTIREFYNKQTREMDEIVKVSTELGDFVEKAIVERNKKLSKVAEFEREIETAKYQLIKLPSPNDFNQVQLSEEGIKLESEIALLQTKVNDSYSSKVSSMDQAEEKRRIRVSELNLMINDNNRRLGSIDNQNKTLRRINELHTVLSKLQDDKNKFTTLVYLCETFERTKNESIEAKLSSMFGQIKWRLFENLQSGGTVQVCDPLLKGKPYGAQSTGEQIFTGCDIIRTFQSIYDISIFVIIDNRESLTLDVQLTSQVISMYADDRYISLVQA